MGLGGEGKKMGGVVHLLSHFSKTWPELGNPS